MLKDGEPCSHAGCLSHATHPCETCGRIAGRTWLAEYAADYILKQAEDFMLNGDSTMEEPKGMLGGYK